MFPYLFLAGLTTLTAAAWRNRAAMLLSIAVFAVYYIAMSGLRYRVGMDWNNYTHIFEDTRGLSFRELAFQTEWAWGIFLYVLHGFGGDFFLINLFAATILGVGMALLLMECEEPMVGLAAALPVLLYAVGMSATRQTIAIGIELFLIAKWDRLALPIKVALIVLASGFHFSALFLIILVFADALKRNWQRVAIGGLIGILVAYVVQNNESHLSYYSQTYTSGEGMNYAPGALYHLGLVAIPAAIMVLFRKRWIAVFGVQRPIWTLAIVGLVCIPAIALSPAGADRMGLYVWPAAIVIYAGMPKLFESRRLQVLVRFGVIASSVFTLVVWMTAANDRIAFVPYKFWGPTSTG